MIRILLLALLMAVTPAHAKNKTGKPAAVRVSEAFQLLLPQLKRYQVVQSPIDEWANRSVLMMRPPARYIANRPAFFAAGKLMIYRECEVDLTQDPGEHSCRPVWAWM